MGWIPVCDRDAKLPILGVRYQAEGGFLALRWSNLRLIFEGVPEDVYLKLRGHAMSSVYYRSQIKGKYPCVDTRKLTTLAPHEPSQSAKAAIKRKQDRQAKERLDAVTGPVTLDMFGQVIPGECVTRKSTKRS